MPKRQPAPKTPDAIATLTTIVAMAGQAQDVARNLATLRDGTIASFWTALDDETQDSLLAWASSLTTTNCYWADYEVAQQFIVLAKS